jgi:hypothetical protein
VIFMMVLVPPKLQLESELINEVESTITLKL